MTVRNRKPQQPSLRDITISMISDPRKWPQWPLLPVKQSKWLPTEQRKIGYLIADGTFRIFGGNMWAPNPKTDPVIATYSNATELVDGNWIVD